MKCRFPVLISVKGRQVYVPCGKCAWCRSRVREEWFFRIKNEMKDNLFNRYVTLTYDDEHIPYHVDDDGVIYYDVSKTDIQKFCKDIRNAGFKFRFFISAEYASRPHYHGLFFSNEKIDYSRFWKNGFTKDVLARPGAIKYVTKYILKGSETPVGSTPIFHTMSRRPGIGSSFNYKGDDYVLTENGVKVLPSRFYRKNYVNSLNEKLRSLIVERSLDKMSSYDQHQSFHKLYESLKIQYPFEDWLSDLYKKDFIAQIKINKK